MKRIVVFCIALAAGFLCGTGCGAGEARPGHVTLNIRGGKATGVNFESARIPVIKTALRGDTLEVDIRTELTGKGTLDFDIPKGARKIRLYGCSFDLPPPDHTAFFRAVLMGGGKARLAAAGGNPVCAGSDLSGAGPEKDRCADPVSGIFGEGKMGTGGAQFFLRRRG